jgi:hypothetical protein
VRSAFFETFDPESAVIRAENMSRIRATSTTDLSWEMTRLLTLVIFEDYAIGGPYIMTGDPQQLGTLNQADRSKQYTRADAGELLKSLNEAWTKIRLLEVASAKKDVLIGGLYKKLRKYRMGYTAMVSIITGLAWEGVRALLPIALAWFRP